MKLQIFCLDGANVLKRRANGMLRLRLVRLGKERRSSFLLSWKKRGKLIESSLILRIRIRMALPKDAIIETGLLESGENFGVIRLSEAKGDVATNREVPGSSSS